MLDEVHATLTRFVIFPNADAAIALTLWIAATHAQQAWQHATRFVLESPVKRCGKTRAQEIARELVNRPLSTTNISVAALVRSLDEADPPCLILDEADTIFRARKERPEGAEDLRGILNSGHSRGWPYIRWDAKANRREECPTFAMALLAGIGRLPDTIEDRAVVVTMQRRAPGEPIAAFRRRRVVPVLQDLRTRLHDGVGALLDQLAGAEPQLPVEDRAADVWEPLLAIADAAGGCWPTRARRACLALSGQGTADEGTSAERLLEDLASVWGEGVEHLFTSTILDRLHELDEAPWSTWFGRKLSARDLAILLRPYGVRSRTVRMGDTTAKGYARDDLVGLWRRYVTGVTTVTTPSAGDTTPDQSPNSDVTHV